MPTIQEEIEDMFSEYSDSAPYEFLWKDSDNGTSPCMRIYMHGFGTNLIDWDVLKDNAKLKKIGIMCPKCKTNPIFHRGRCREEVIIDTRECPNCPGKTIGHQGECFKSYLNTDNEEKTLPDYILDILVSSNDKLTITDIYDRLNRASRKCDNFIADKTIMAMRISGALNNLKLKGLVSNIKTEGSRSAKWFIVKE